MSAENIDTPELTPDEEALWNMDDDELEAAFNDRIADNELEEEPVNTDELVDEPDDDEELDEADNLEPEQPDDNEDSDDTEEEEDGTDEDEPEAQPEETLDEDETKEAEKESEPEIKEPSKYKVRANGTDYEFTEEELVKQLAPKALDYTRKMQEIKPWRKTIDALGENGLGHDDINLFIDAIKGSKDAVAEIVKKAGVDTLELADVDDSKVYTPKEYGLSETELDIKDIESRISADKEYAITADVFNNQWDDASRDAMFKNPEFIEGLHSDIKSGTFDKVMPMAMKRKVLDGAKKSDLRYYLEAGQEYAKALKIEAEQEQARIQAEKETEKIKLKEQAAIEKAKADAEKQKKLNAKKTARKSAVPTKKSAGRKTVQDYLNDDDEAFEEWYKKTMSEI